MNGDINIFDLAEPDFKKLSHDDREWLMFQTVRSLNSTCHNRPATCERKFVKVKHVAIGTLIILAFLVGMGTIQMQVILPHMIKVAIAGALAP